MRPVEFDQFLSAFMLFLAITGFLLLLVVPKTERFHQTRVLGIAFFSVGLGGTALLFLVANPYVLEDMQENIAVILLGMVIATLSAIRLFKS